MFLLKNSNLVSLSLGGRGVSIVFSRKEKEVKVSSWKKKMVMSVERDTPWLDLWKAFRKAGSKTWGETKCLPLLPGPDSQPIPLAAFVFKKTCLGCLLLQKHHCSQWTGHISQAVCLLSRKHMVHDKRRNNGGEGKDYFYSVDIFKMLQQSWL